VYHGAMEQFITMTMANGRKEHIKSGKQLAVEMLEFLQHCNAAQQAMIAARPSNRKKQKNQSMTGDKSEVDVALTSVILQCSAEQ